MSDIDTANEVLRSIRRILRRTSEYSRQLARTSGMTLPQLLCLRAIRDAPDAEISVARLSGAVQLSPATVSRILDRLERAGHILRVRGSHDRRKVYVSLTAKGEESLQHLPTTLQEQFVRRLCALPAAEQQSLLESLETIVELMEAAHLDAAPLLEPGVSVKPDAPS